MSYAWKFKKQIKFEDWTCFLLLMNIIMNTINKWLYVDVVKLLIALEKGRSAYNGYGVLVSWYMALTLTTQNIQSSERFKFTLNLCWILLVANLDFSFICSDGSISTRVDSMGAQRPLWHEDTAETHLMVSASSADLWPEPPVHH